MSEWFAKVRAGDFSLDDAPQLGKRVEADSNQMETLRTVDDIDIRDYNGKVLEIILISNKG